jgi:multidrug efflux pump subunit AcrB
MDFLVRRPIAVIMAFLGLVIIGAVMFLKLPVSLLPDIDIPKITVQTSNPELSAREIETSVISVLRQQLLQVAGLENIESKTRDGSGVINMTFKFGTSIDYAYIEVNEKIDAAMNYLPSGTKRPSAIKAGAADIPVFYINVSLKNKEENEGEFLQMCSAVENIIRPRIEQLPEVAMADITGVPKQCITIRPDMEKLRTLSLDLQDVISAVISSNIETSNLSVKDGVYEYSVRVSSLLTDISEVENIFIKINDKILTLKDLCTVSLDAQKEQGFSFSDGKKSVSIAVIKQAEEGMKALRKRISELSAEFERQFPGLDFKISRNQTELLDFTISNLEQNLVLGFLLIIVVAVAFIGSFRVSFVIGIVMAVSLVITFVPFFIFNRSLNTVSLSGLILVVGMMIDNALIISENISQWQIRGKTLRVSCGGATAELITPLLSSSLTTVAVFVPLVFISGIAGAVFSDEAFAITAGLAVSFFTGIILLPVVYRLFLTKRVRQNKVLKVENTFAEKFYDKFYDKFSAHKTVVLVLTALTLPLCAVLFNVIRFSKMPETKGCELTAKIEWNGEVSADENLVRTQKLLAAAENVSEYSAYVGVKDFICDAGQSLSQSETEVYWKANSAENVAELEQNVKNYMAANYPNSEITFAPPLTVFEKIFDSSEPDLSARIFFRNGDKSADEIRKIEKRIKAAAPENSPSNSAFSTLKKIVIDRKALTLYNVDLQTLEKMLENHIEGSLITELHSYSTYMPVRLKISDTVDIDDFIKTGFVKSSSGENVPVRALVKTADGETLKTITAGKNGEYVPVDFYGGDVETICQKIRKITAADTDKNIEFSGAFFSNRELMRELTTVLLISVLLMYFIMCAQFESFLQPLIVLIEIPVDTAFALFVLWLSGQTLNLLSGIGIVVASGIIVNDSILKLDTINSLIKQGYALETAVHLAGKRRLRAIVMTSLTTIGAMLPVLFTSDLGSQIQKPLAVAMIAAMSIGTVVSLFVVPLVYMLIEKRKAK